MAATVAEALAEGQVALIEAVPVRVNHWPIWCLTSPTPGFRPFCALQPGNSPSTALHGLCLRYLAGIPEAARESIEGVVELRVDGVILFSPGIWLVLN